MRDLLVGDLGIRPRLWPRVDDNDDLPLAIEVLILVDVNLGLVAQDQLVFAITADLAEQFAMRAKTSQGVQGIASRPCRRLMGLTIDVNPHLVRAFRFQ